ncbi:MAG TPA: glycosyltransferase [Paludibaculum sp.]|jgi:GT2 family glycosyltransferase
MTGDITVIIPNWNGGSRLERTLQSVASQSLAPRSVIVIDDASTDDSPLAAERAGAEVIRLARNSGFSHAVNTGVRAAATSWVFILNNDVILDDDCLNVLLGAAQSAAVTFAAPKLRSLREPGHLDGSFDLLARSGCAWRAGHGQPESGEFFTSAPVQFVPLTAALIDRQVFLETGCLEERFETYLEDVELFLRYALLGHSGLYVQDALAWHEGSATHGAWSPRMVQLIARNQLLLVARHWPRNWFVRYGWPVVAGQLLWGLLACQRGAGGAWLKGKWAGLRMFSEFRSGHTPADPIAFERILTASESRLRQLQKAFGPERFWSAYFLCVPEGRP